VWIPTSADSARVQPNWGGALFLQVAFSLLSWLTPAKKPEVQPINPARSGLLQTFERVAEEKLEEPPKPITPIKAKSATPSTPRTKEKSPHKGKSPLTPRNGDGTPTSAATASGSASKEAAVNLKHSPASAMEEKPDMFAAMASMLITPKRST
jgi:hypothetical protein